MIPDPQVRGEPARTPRAYVAGAYAVALGMGIAVVAWLAPESSSPSSWIELPWARALIADVVATVAVFAFSVTVRNASVYDPYWTVAPVPIVVWWASLGGWTPRGVVLVSLVSLWSARLTWNWLRRWRGFGDEDWRYAELRANTGRAYPAVNLFGIHLFPTLLVFAGMLPWYVAVSGAQGSFGAFAGSPGTGDAAANPLGTNALTSWGWLDTIACIVVLAAIAIEWIADEQLHAFLRNRRRHNASDRDFLDRGLWAWSRHPNYFGELLFWWGTFLFAIAAHGATALWTIVGPLAMTALFFAYSIPAMDRRMRARRTGYEAYRSRTSAVVPWPRRGSGRG